MVDISSACLIKQNFNFPLVIDQSHGTGIKQIMGSVAKAFLAIGSNGHMMEVHNNPEIAKCDKEQALNFDEYKEIFRSLNFVNAPVNIG